MNNQSLVPDGHSLRGVSRYVKEGKIVSEWVKTSTSKERDIVADIKEALDKHKTSRIIKVPERTRSELVTVYPLPDWHVGLLAWGKEVGQDYDSDIAQKEISDVMGKLMRRTPESKQAVILGLGDLMHIDSYDHVTPASKNNLDADGRYPKVLQVATEMCLSTIDMALSKHENVLVRILPGNHDEQSAIAVTLAVSMYYKNMKRIKVDVTPSRYWWWRWGNTFLGATHGDKAKMNKLPGVMASRNPEDWGKTKHRYIYTGHIHTQTGMEIDGVAVESFQSPAVGDAWHHAMGYGAKRSVVAITHDKYDGEIRRDRVNL